MAQYSFGVGQVTLIPPGTNQTPLPLAVLKDITLEVSFDIKRLMGSNGFPVDVARGAGKITGKAKYAQVRGNLWASVLTGATTTTGSTYGVLNQSTGVISGAAYDVGFVKANFVDDLGAVDETGTPLKVVAAAPAVGEYFVNMAGANPVYTFNAVATGKTYTVSYSRKDGLTTSQTVTYNNQLMGASTIYQVAMFNSFRSKNIGLKLFAVSIPKLGMGFKQDDYTDQDMDMEGFSDSSNRVLEMYFSEP